MLVSEKAAMYQMLCTYLVGLCFFTKSFKNASKLICEWFVNHTSGYQRRTQLWWCFDNYGAFSWSWLWKMDFSLDKYTYTEIGLKEVETVYLQSKSNCSTIEGKSHYHYMKNHLLILRASNTKNRFWLQIPKPVFKFVQNRFLEYIF